MKIFKVKTIVLVTLSMIAFGCTDLDENVYSDIVAEETSFTADDLNAIIAPPYTKFRDIYWGWDGLFDLYEESSDLLVTPARNGIGWGAYYVDMHKHNWLPGLSHTEALWDRCYKAINESNKSIFQIEGLGKVEGANVYIAEIQALRAMYYYILYDNFRRVPIVTKYDVEEGFLPEQATSQEVYDFIISELTEAMPLLKEEKDYGRVTKWTAKMTLAKMYLNSEVYTGTARWSDALNEVQDVIDTNLFPLTSNYSDVFAIENEKLSETIFAIPFDRVYAGGSYVAWKALFSASKETFDLSGSPWGGSGAIPQFIDTYDEDDQRLTDTWLGGPQVTSSGDPLLLADGTQFVYTNYMSSIDGAEFNEGYRFVRYEIGAGDEMTSSNDVPFYRITDALMIKAECLLRTGDADGAAAIVSDIRARSFKSNPAKAMVTGAQLLGGSVYQYGSYEAGEITNLEGGNDIQYGGFLDELAWEFIGETHRKQDLIRFGVYTTKSWLSHKPNGANRTVFPIPESQLLSNSNLTQNDYQ